MYGLIGKMKILPGQERVNETGANSHAGAE